ncbi:MAG: RidA family protein [Clostridiales bacterium]|nr:RidA family protein [Clostridiales bacterium]
MNKQEVKTNNAPAAIGAYSQGIQAGNLVFASGQMPVDPATGEVVSGGIAEQARQAIENMKAVMQAANASLDDVIKTTVFIKNMADFGVINDIYASYFKAPFPARSCVEVARLPKDVLIEIEAIARVE